jgi:hypothetical protein
MTTVHPQVRVTVGDRSADIDEGIVALIETLWRLDIDTLLSCQSNPRGRIWLCMPPDAARDFLSVLSAFESCEPERRLGAFDYGDRYAWRYELLPDDWRGEVRLLVSVRFPRFDLPEVMRRLHEALGADGEDIPTCARCGQADADAVEVARTGRGEPLYLCGACV